VDERHEIEKGGISNKNHDPLCTRITADRKAFVIFPGENFVRARFRLIKARASRRSTIEGLSTVFFFFYFISIYFLCRRRFAEANIVAGIFQWSEKKGERINK